MLTVSPNRQYRGILSPTTAATHGPVSNYSRLVKIIRRKDFYLKIASCFGSSTSTLSTGWKTTAPTADRSMTHRLNIWEPHWSTRRSTWTRIRRKSSHARMPCSWPMSAAVTAWASRHITIYLTQQSTQLVPDVVKVHTLRNTGFWSALEPSQHDETSLVKQTRRWRFWRINQERQC